MKSAEYLVVLQVLHRPGGRDVERMLRALRLERDELDDAISSLELAGIVEVRGQKICATDALARLDRLNLIAV